MFAKGHPSLLSTPPLSSTVQQMCFVFCLIPWPLPLQWALTQLPTGYPPPPTSFAWVRSLALKTQTRSPGINASSPLNPGSSLQTSTDRSWYLSTSGLLPFGRDMLLETPTCNTALYDFNALKCVKISFLLFIYFCHSTWSNRPWVLKNHLHMKDATYCATGCYEFS